MKFSLTITDATKEEVAAFLGGSSAALPTTANIMPMTTMTTMTMPNVATAMPGAAQTNNDDNGPVNANAPAVDSAGFPWNDQIHSKNKALNADGTWRKKRNVDPALVTSVEAALRGAVPQQPQQPVMQQPMQMTPTMPATIPPMPDQSQQQMQQPVMQQPMQMMQQPGPMDFNAFMMHLAAQMQKRDAQGAPLITTDYLASIAQRLTAQLGKQFNSITDISGDPNAIAMAVNFITLDGRWN